MSAPESLATRLESFLRALDGDGPAPEGVRGRIGVYRHAYLERIRASIAEDFPRLFARLEALGRVPGEFGPAAVTRDLLARNPPASWTLAEASRPIRESVGAMLRGASLEAELSEALRLADLDEAELIAGWVEEWPDPRAPKAERVGDFAAGKLRLARTRSWREAGGRVFWRDDTDVWEAPAEDFREFAALLALVTEPIGFAEFADRAGEAAEPADVSRFLERGVGDGWLRFVP